MKKYINKYRHVWTLLYIFIYIPWFVLLENTITPASEFTNIHVRLDDMIPFCEWFVIPYLLWFLYVPAVMLFFALTSRDEWYRASAYLFAGMSICLFICTIWPNGQDLRIIDLDPDKNIFTGIMSFIYSADTNTNVFPSIHSYNSVAVFMMLFMSKELKGGKRVPILAASGILSVLIILSTMFLKQHSVVDALGGIALGAIMVIPVYRVNWKMVFSDKKQTSRQRRKII